MAEEKKKRGRPPKKVQEVDINENQTTVKMKELTSTPVTIDKVNSRLSEMFNTLSSNGTKYSSFLNAINRVQSNFAFGSNPFIQNNRIKSSNQKIKTISKKELNDALEAPDNNEDLLRSQSMILYYKNYVYGNLLRLNRDIPKYFNYNIPQNVKKEDLKSDKFKQEKYFVDKFTEKFNIPLTFKNVSLQVAQEGKCSYVFRSSFNKSKQIVDYALLQKLPPEYVKYTGFGGESPLICSFNFLMFMNPMYDINQWPNWMQDIWKQLIENGVVKKGKSGLEFNPNGRFNRDHIIETIDGRYAYWVELPQDLVYTFGMDFSNPLAIPEAIGLFSDLNELENYKWLQTQTLLTNITNILTATVPIEKDAKGGSDAAILTPEVILGLEGDCSSSLNSNILPFFAPLEDFKMHSVERVPNAMEITLNNLRNLIATSGTSALINTSDKPSIAMIKGTQNLYETKMEYLTLQYEKFINMIINKYLGLTYSYKCIIWGGTYNWRDDLKVLKEMIQNGNYGFLPRLLSAYNTTIEEYKSCCDYVDLLEIFPKEEELDTTKADSDTNQNGVGRKPKEDDEIMNDNTAASIEGGQNVSDNKD